MFDKKNTRIAVVFAAIGIVIGIVATLSFTLYSPANSGLSKEECTGENNCVILAINGSQYMLKGEAYQAYLDFENIASPLHTIRLESQSLPSDIPYLIGIEGRTSEVQSLVKKYNVTESSAKVHPNGNFTDFYGWIYKENLVRFLGENTVEPLKARSLSVHPVAGYSDENGTVNRVPFPMDQQKIIEEHTAFREAEISRILTQETGVTRISG